MDATKLQVEKSAAREVVMRDLRTARAWQALAVLSAAAIAFIYWHTFEWWWGVWGAKDSYYSHGVLVPFISAFVVCLNWRRIAGTPVAPSVWGAALVLPAALVHVVAQRSGIPSVSGLTLPATLIGISLLLLGKRVTSQLLFPTLYLYFMCVPPTNLLESLSFKIRLLSTTAAVLGLKSLGYAVVQQGTTIEMPSVVVQVAAQCSGVRILISLIAFATIFAYLKQGPMWGRLTLVALAIPLSVVANTIRVTMNALVGEYMGSDIMHMFDFWAGIIVLVLSLVILWLFAKVVKCPEFKQFDPAPAWALSALRRLERCLRR